MSKKKTVFIIKDKAHWKRLRKSKRWSGFSDPDVGGYPYFVPLTMSGNKLNKPVVMLGVGTVMNLAAAYADLFGEEWLRLPKNKEK